MIYNSEWCLVSGTICFSWLYYQGITRTYWVTAVISAVFTLSGLLQYIGG